jgi:hypothetical protein
LVSIAPEEAPVTKTRPVSAPYVRVTQSTIERMPTGSLPPSRRSAWGEETSQHLLLRVTDG